VRDGKNIRLGVDPWISDGNDFKLTMGMCTSLITINRTPLEDVIIMEGSILYGGGWVKEKKLGLEDQDIIESECFVQKLIANIVRHIE